jgi:hypothetical protein
MNQRRVSHRLGFLFLCGLLIASVAARRTLAEPTPEATAAFNSYVTQIEARLALQHRSQDAFLSPISSATASAIDSARQSDLLQGEPVIENVVPATSVDLPGALLHHWRGTAFVPGGNVAGFERLLKDFDAYPQRFFPQVLQAKVLTQNRDRLQASMRVRQKHVLTVVFDTTYDIAFGQLDAQHGYSISRSVRIAEIGSPGTAAEHTLDASAEHGFLWRQNTYWSYEERDGGLYIQVESLSLSRSIPAGLGWALRTYVDTVPRESLEFTLLSVCRAMRKNSTRKNSN